MILKMAGYDYTTCPLEAREQLALTKTGIHKMLSSVSARPDVEGCVYVSTCGRGELYLFCGEDVDAAACFMNRGGSPEVSTRLPDTDAIPEVSSYLRCRTGREVARHLFHVACGMRSQIYGEDQILSQLKQSLELAREAQTAGHVLDRLFLSAVSAAKKVKSTVRLTAVPASVADRMMALLESMTQVKGKNCLVIGNGEIGRLCAAKLLEAGANVTVTVRSYRTKEVRIPVGCRIVDYKDRYAALPSADVIVSATASPHLTLPFPAAGQAETPDESLFLDGRRRWLFDLALPRDIAPEYGHMPGVRLFGLDEVSAFGTDGQTPICGTDGQTPPGTPDEEESTRLAEEILVQAEDDFFLWMDSRETSGQAAHVGELAAADVARRIHKRLEKAEHTGQMEAICEDAVKKVVDNLMYDLRERLPGEAWKACVSAMEQSANERAEQAKENAPHNTPNTAQECQPYNTQESRPRGGAQKPKDGAESPAALEYFPLFLDTRNKTVLIYGAGSVALRRVKKLLDFSCDMIVVAPEAKEELLGLAERFPERICYMKKEFDETRLSEQLEKGKRRDLQGKARSDILFVTAATDDRSVNRRVGEICRACGMPVSVADCAEESTCYFPGIATGNMKTGNDVIVAGISSEGRNHALTAEAVKQITTVLR